MMRTQTSELKSQERGSILVYFALLLVVILGFGAIALDGSNAFVVQRRMQNAADAAALAGARLLAIGSSYNEIDYAVNELATSNGADQVSWEFAEDGNAVKVTTESTFETAFARLFGIETMTARASAEAAFGPVQEASNLLPMTAACTAFVYGETYRLWQKEPSEGGSCSDEGDSDHHDDGDSGHDDDGDSGHHDGDSGHDDDGDSGHGDDGGCCHDGDSGHGDDGDSGHHGGDSGHDDGDSGHHGGDSGHDDGDSGHDDDGDSGHDDDGDSGHHDGDDSEHDDEDEGGSCQEDDMEAPGNFGWLDWNGGSPSTPELADNILHPENSGSWSIGDLIPSAPGVRASSQIIAALNTWMGKNVTIPLYDEVTGSGNNARYRVCGFGEFVLTDFNFHGSDKYIEGYFVRTVIPDGEIGGDNDYGVSAIRLSH